MRVRIPEVLILLGLATLGWAGGRLLADPVAAQRGLDLVGAGWSVGPATAAPDVVPGGRRAPRTLAAKRARTAATEAIPAHRRGEPLGDDAMELAGELAALGYVDGPVEAAADRVDGVSAHRAERTASGLNLVTPGGHPVAVLLDMDGEEVHRWTFGVRDAWPELPVDRHDSSRPVAWRRAEVLDGGDLLAIWSGYGMVRLDRDSRLKWASFLPVHHDFHTYDDGASVVLTRRFVARPELELKGVEIMEDFLTWLDPDGLEVRSFSVLDAFMAYEGWPELWAQRPKRRADIFHTNAVFVLEQDWSHVHPAFGEGRILTSMRHLDALALVDPDTEEVVWAMTGEFSRQHDPQILPDGHLLVFDNHGGAKRSSQVLEYDLATGALVWSYRGTEDDPFTADSCGNAQRLDNGNTLINESSSGRAFEVDGNGEIVWAYQSPWRLAGDEQFVSRFYEFTRLDAGLDVGWLD